MSPRALIARREGRTVAAFRYRDYGSLATIGRSAGGRAIRQAHVSGLLAWVLWSVAHIYFLIGFRNRFIVALNWAWSYLTFQRGSRLITGLYARSRGICISAADHGAAFEGELDARLGGTFEWKCIRSGIFWRSPGR